MIGNNRGIMKITFDPAFDSGYWPGPLQDRNAASGEIWVGPSGLLGLLETMTGLSGPPVPITSEIFARAFKPHGIPKERVSLKPAIKSDPPELGHFMEWWELDTCKRPGCFRHCGRHSGAPDR